ncbi:MAG: alpha/beta fold hydrolase [Planctomycetota bacterium]|nr:alpha/beta fold hydrolase [Planctomycetota bacterium]
MNAKNALKWFGYFLAGFVVVFVLSVLGYNIVTGFGLRRYEKSLPNPKDGVPVSEAAPFSLTPEGESATEAVMFVHGFGDCPMDFAQLPQLVARDGYAVRAVLLAGHGTSPRELKHVTVQDHLSHLGDEYARLAKSYDKVHLVGFSFGGTLSTILAARAEKRPASLTLLAPCFEVSRRRSFLLSPESWAKTFGWMIPYVSKVEAFPPTNDPSMRGKVFSYRYVPTNSVVVLSEAEQVARNPETLSRRSGPALFIHSLDDRVASFDASLKAYRQLATKPENKVFVELHRSNHLLMWDYEREIVRDRVCDFFGVSSKGPYARAER